MPPALIRHWRLCAAYAVVVVLSMLAGNSAHAVPAYARQTGSACADCHAGAYGPALTPYGMRFKLNGYTDTDGQGTKIPVAAQLIGTRTIPERGDNTTQLTEADIYLAGRISDHLGGFVKVETDNNGKDQFSTKLSNLDLRFVAKDLKIAGKDTIVGVSINNSPGFDDPIGALPNASTLGPPAISGTLLNLSSPNSLNNRVIGGGVYALYDDNWYGEIGTYNAMPTSTQDHLGYNTSGDPGRLSDTGYFRFAYMKDMKRQFFSAGVVALTTKRQLPRNAQSDDITDLGYDLTYQFLGNRDHIVQASFVNILEQRNYGSTPTINGLAAKSHGDAHDRTLSVTYTFLQSYALQVAHLASTGTEDPARYPPFGTPDSTANLISLYWTPFGKDDSFTSKANLKIAATWFRFTRFNGVSDNIFGAPPGVPMTQAKDLDAFTLSASVAF
ncbi:cytochrome C [Dyella terrae]|uniref:cytochrome C n=1 Tax=Dyella terrae TaxID=522259 RepID=UPI003D1878F5|nr:cytochrome C [Dyella terrae]